MQNFWSVEQGVDLREKSLGSSKDFMHENDVLIEEVTGDETGVLDVISVLGLLQLSLWQHIIVILGLLTGVHTSLHITRSIVILEVVPFWETQYWFFGDSHSFWSTFWPYNKP